jgi:hypothetical protein
VGTVNGVVRLTGGPVPESAELKAKLPRGKCLSAHAVHGTLVREGPERALADALVAVTEYQGLVPAPNTVVTVEARDCALERRTVVLTFGQMLHFVNRGPEAAAPQLVGVPSPALLVAMPSGEPVPLLAPQPGRYQLIDRSHPFATADVFVLAYPTATVTGVDGRFSIEGVPVGEAKLSVLLPVTGQTLEQKITVTEGQPTNLALELEVKVPAP